MAADSRQAGGRFFIGLATSKHPHNDELDDRPELVDAVRDMRDLFTALGYESVPGFDADLGIDDVRRRLGDFLTHESRSEFDTVVFYYTGHGLVDGGDFLLPFPETTADLWRTGLGSSTLATWILRGTRVRRFLVIFDTCHAGAAGGDLAKESISRLSLLGGQARSPTVAIVAAARPRESARSCAFTASFMEAVRHPSSGGHEPEFLPLDSIMTMVENRTPPWQHVTLFFNGEAAGVSEFLPNPRYNPQGRDLDLRTRDTLQERLRETELESHVWPRAQGLDVPMEGRWLFTGRIAAMSRLSRWLADDRGTSLVVTGGPGSGKSALLARLFVLADPVHRRRVPGLDDIPAAAMPATGSVRRFIHARGKTVEEVLAGLCEAAETGADSVVDLLAALKRRDDPIITVIVDAVDEASDPDALVHEVLRPIVRNGAQCHLRLLIGTRRHLLSELGAASIDIDDAGFADPASVQAYAQRCLLEIVPDSPYNAALREVTDKVASAVGSASGKSFLVALITARSLALRADVVRDPDDSRWRAGLPREAAAAMERDINERLGPLAQKARDLLLPLAYAEGAGLPWEDIWARVASAVSGRRYRDKDIDWLVRHAGYYIIEAKEEQRSSYRLYHEALAEHLRGPDDEASRARRRSVHDRFLRGLRSTVDGQQWRRAHPYVRRHLATHAARAGDIDQYLLNPHYLTSADRSRLLDAAKHARTVPGRRAALAFQQATHASTGDFETLVAYLELAAHQYGAVGLAESIAESGLPAPWRTVHAAWSPSPPHRVLCRLNAAIDTVGVTVIDGSPSVVASAGGGVRAWELDSERAFCEVTFPRGGPGRMVPPAGAQDGGRLVYRSGTRLYAVTLGADSASLRRLARRVPRECSPIALLAGDGMHTVFVVGRNRARVRFASAGGNRSRPDGDLGRQACGSPVGSGIEHLATLRSAGIDLLVTGNAHGDVGVWDVDALRLLQAWRASDGPLDFLLGCEVDGKQAVITIAPIGGRRTVDDEGEDIATALRAVDKREKQDLQTEARPRQELKAWLASSGTPEAIVGYTLEEPVSALAVASVNGRSFVITGSTDGALRIREMATGRLEYESPRGHAGAVTSVATFHSPSGSIIVSGGADGTVRLWDLGPHLLSEDLESEAHRIWSVALAGAGGTEIVVAGAEDVSGRSASRLPSHLLMISDARTGSRKSVLQQPGGPVAMIAVVEHGGKQLALTTASQDCVVYTWDLRAGPVDRWMAHSQRITALAAAVVSGATVAFTASEDGTVKAWDFASGRLRGVLWRGGGDVATALAIVETPGLHAVMIGTRQGRIALLDITTGRAKTAVVNLRRSVDSLTIDSVHGKALARAQGRCIAVTISAGHGIRWWLPRRRVKLAASAVVDLSTTSAQCGTRRGLWAIGSGDRIIIGDGQAGTIGEINIWSIVQSVAINDDGTIVAAAADGLVVLRLSDVAWLAQQTSPAVPSHPLAAFVRARGDLTDLPVADADAEDSNLAPAELTVKNDDAGYDRRADYTSTDDTWIVTPFDLPGTGGAAARTAASVLLIAMVCLLVFAIVLLTGRAKSTGPPPQSPPSDVYLVARVICDPASPLFEPGAPICVLTRESS
ncbi:hypothetical protein GCM10010169_64140 [Micromonospora fulviviridis]|uniref:caspase family protein n=1 Tax=Micromonospora fulviviridis TaxID=47860 RepID=UPI00166DB0F4|nr:caspase family protein [Micromonospora fulviviridis]GGS10663.1 hypothetical protein GCM10010169_64140 [Micromonospora fulviviridis]